MRQRQGVPKSARMMLLLVVFIAALAVGLNFNKLFGGTEDILDDVDPTGYDTMVSCNGVQDNHLICNESKDTYLFLDDAPVYLQKNDSVIDNDGNEETTVLYKEYSIDRLRSYIQDHGTAGLYLWLTSTGKVKTIMLHEESVENNNDSMKVLGNLDPSSYTLANCILKATSKSLTLAPTNYTAETAKNFEGQIQTYRIAKKAEFYTVNVTITVDKDDKKTKNTKYAKSSLTHLRDLLKVETVKGYFWLNKKGEIATVMVYREKTLWP